MKRTIIIAFLSVFICSLPAHSGASTKKIKTTEITKESDKINLNNADVAKLVNSFKGIGTKRAEEIVKYREAHGNFKSVAELTKVRGFGKTFVEKNINKLNEKFSID